MTQHCLRGILLRTSPISCDYWSSTTYEVSTSGAWQVSMANGQVYSVDKYVYALGCFWPVRAGGGAPVSSYTLTVTKSGSGSGTVTSEPPGIDCGPSCNSSSTTFSQSSTVTLTATPDTGSSFIGWSGGGCSGTGVCIVTMNTDVEVTAGFSCPGCLPVPLPTEGTIGTQLSISGSNFGAKKGKVLIGNSAAKVNSWSDTLIACEIKKLLSPGAYEVMVQPKEPKGVSPITCGGAFTVMGPEIASVEPMAGISGEVIVLSGNYIGSKKGKVYLGTKKCKVVSWTMDSATGASQIQFVVPKKMASGIYSLTVTNKVGSATLTDGFTIP